MVCNETIRNSLLMEFNSSILYLFPPLDFQNGDATISNKNIGEKT